LIAWGNYVQLVKIINRPTKKGLPPLKCIQILVQFTTEFLISGIAPFEGNFLILANSKQEDKGNVAGGVRPELHVMSPNNEEVTCDALGITGFEKFHSKDYRLCFMKSEYLFYLVSPKDIVVAQLRDTSDHIQWLLDHQKYKQVLSAIEGRENEFTHISGVSNIGKVYIESLIDEGKYEEAALEAKNGLKDNLNAWSEITFAFIKANKAVLLLPHIPIHNPTLPCDVYFGVLSHLVDCKEYSAVLETIAKWPPIYTPKELLKVVTSKLGDTNIYNMEHDQKQLNELFLKLTSM